MTAKKLGFRVLSILAALPFLGAGFAKLTNQQMLVDEFTRWNLPMWFMYFTGIVEIVGAILILIPKTRLWGGLVLSATMIGAVFVHLINNEASMIGAPIVLFILPALISYMQYRKISKKA